MPRFVFPLPCYYLVYSFFDRLASVLGFGVNFLFAHMGIAIYIWMLFYWKSANYFVHMNIFI
jgi:hypothetical protein